MGTTPAMVPDYPNILQDCGAQHHAMQGTAAQAIGISFTCDAKNPDTYKMIEPYSGQRDFSWGGVSFRIQTKQSMHDEHPFQTLNI